MQRSRDRRAGFTILELCLTLLLLTVVATASIWAYFSRAEVTLVNAAQLLVEDLRLAQAHAACTHQSVAVVFHEDAAGYHVEVPEGEGLPTAKQPRSYPIDAVFEGVRIQMRRLPDPHRLEFDARGRLRGDASITLAYRGETLTVLAHADGTVDLADGP
jgi:Tfp pilus assembly protein FimT